MDEKVIHILKLLGCSSNDLLLWLGVEYQQGVKSISIRLCYKYNLESSAWVFSSKPTENADLLQSLECEKEYMLLV